MNLQTTLCRFIAPELNHLYTVPPHMTDGYIDCGWSCREHALHLYTLCVALGIQCEVCLGEFVVHSPAVPLTSSGGLGDAHAWCRLNRACPVDLSMTFWHYGNGPQLKAPVFGIGVNGEYLITYRNSADEKTKRPQHPHVIVFHEFTRRKFKTTALLADPYELLIRPRENDDLSWHVLFGPSIYGKISLHCLRIAQRRTTSINRNMNAKEAVRWICQNYKEEDVISAFKSASKY